ncbi:MAG: pseudouridine synthase [Porticoccaceae bacterium]|nr:pseudouridine synthase [Porticoccaceae bacterium]
MRLDKYISNATDLSRTDAKRLIKNGEVTIDDEAASNPAQKISDDQIVAIEGSTINMAQSRYFMMNKPAGVVSVTKDHNNPTAIGLMYEHRSEELQIAGRLDIDTTGLLLITDNGQWNHRLTSPRSDCAKIYEVGLAEPVGANYQAALAEGVMLENEKHRCMPAHMNQIDEHHLTLSIAEGKYHQVKRMFAALGNHVVSLHRFQVGDIVLDTNLEPGEYRALTDIEVTSIQ